MKRDLQKDFELCESVKDRRYIVDVFEDDGLYDWRLGCVKEPAKTKKDPIAEKYVYEAIQQWPEAIRRAMEAEAEVKRLREDMDFLKQEYRDSDDPMTDDALELKARLKILQERDELRAENRRLRETLEYNLKFLKANKYCDYLIEVNRKALEVRE